MVSKSYPEVKVVINCGKPGMQKSEKIIFLEKALEMRVTMELVRAWGGMKGKLTVVVAQNVEIRVILPVLFSLVR